MAKLEVGSQELALGYLAINEVTLPPLVNLDTGPVPGRGVTSGSAFGGARALHEAP